MITCYYVSAIDGPKKYLVAGPYDTHAAAKDKVSEVREMAYQRDKSGRAWFMAWGTAGSAEPERTILGVV